MDEIIREYLITLAKKKDVISYQNLCRKCKLPLSMSNPTNNKKLMDALTRISKSEAENGRSLLSVLVVGAFSKIPGIGFYTLAKELGKYSGSDDEMEKKAFFKKERDKVFLDWIKI